jgi:hypothetical protein
LVKSLKDDINDEEDKKKLENIAKSSAKRKFQMIGESVIQVVKLFYFILLKIR